MTGPIASGITDRGYIAVHFAFTHDADLAMAHHIYFARAICCNDKGEAPLLPRGVDSSIIHLPNIILAVSRNAISVAKKQNGL